MTSRSTSIGVSSFLACSDGLSPVAKRRLPNYMVADNWVDDSTRSSPQSAGHECLAGVVEQARDISAEQGVPGRSGEPVDKSAATQAPGSNCRDHTGTDIPVVACEPDVLPLPGDASSIRHCVPQSCSMSYSLAQPGSVSSTDPLRDRNQRDFWRWFLAW